MGKYNHIKLHLIDIHAVSTKAVPGGVNADRWTEIGVEAHSQSFIMRRWPLEKIKNDPKLLAALVRGLELDPVVINQLVVGANRKNGSQFYSSEDKLLIWINVDPASVEADLLRKFATYKNTAATMAARCLTKEAASLVKRYLERGMSPEVIQDAINIAIVQVVQEM